jgi:hypothetical protein
LLIIKSKRTQLLTRLETAVFKDEWVCEKLGTAQALRRVFLQDAVQEVFELLRGFTGLWEGDLVSDLK